MKNELYKVLFEDDDIIALDKFAGLLTIPDRYDKELPSLSELLTQKYGEIFVVHRLDRDTSGVVLMAKNAESHRNLSIQFQEQKPEKIYHAVVNGIIDKDLMDIDIPIESSDVLKGVSIPSSRGKASLTKLSVLQRFRIATLVQCQIITGRHHQLRVHVSAIGHPLFVDLTYGGRKEFFLSEIKNKFNLKKHTEEIPIISRISMHSYSLTIEHPKTSEKLIFSAEYPKDFRALISVLNKYSKSR